MERMETKVCVKCGKELPVSKFYHNSNSEDGYSAVCRPCACTRRKPIVGGNPALAMFQPRELIAELRFRGYRGELELTQKIKV